MRNHHKVKQPTDCCLELELVSNLNQTNTDLSQWFELVVLLRSDLELFAISTSFTTTSKKDLSFRSDQLSLYAGEFKGQRPCHSVACVPGKNVTRPSFLR